MVELTRGHPASEAQALAELEADGFRAAVRDYPDGKTEPQRHDDDLFLHILAGEFRLGLAGGVVHSAGPGDRLLVPAGTLHFEEHGPLKMVVGRRRPRMARQPEPVEGA